MPTADEDSTFHIDPDATPPHGIHRPSYLLIARSSVDPDAWLLWWGERSEWQRVGQALASAVVRTAIADGMQVICPDAWSDELGLLPIEGVA